MFKDGSSNTSASATSTEGTSQPFVTITSPVAELNSNATDQVNTSTEAAHGSPLSSVRANASKFLHRVKHVHSPSLHPSPMASPSLSDNSAMPSPAFSTVSMNSSPANSPLPTPAPAAHNALGSNVDNVMIQSSPMAPLEGLPSLSTLDSSSNLLGLDGEGFPAPKQQASVVKSHDSSSDIDTPTTGSSADPAVHTFQLNMTREHVKSLLESIRGSNVHVEHVDGFRTFNMKFGPVMLNIRQGPY